MAAECNPGRKPGEPTKEKTHEPSKRAAELGIQISVAPCGAQKINNHNSPGLTPGATFCRPLNAGSVSARVCSCVSAVVRLSREHLVCLTHVAIRWICLNSPLKPLLHCGFMTRRRLFPSHVWRMAIVTLAGLFELCQLTFNRHDVFVSDRLVVIVAGFANGNRYVRSKTAQRDRSRNIDMTGGALGHVCTLAALMTELRRLARRQIKTNKRGRRLMTTSTIITGRPLILPVTVEARVVRVRHGFEDPVWLRCRIRRGRERNHVRNVVRLVTDRAVVVIRFLLIQGFGFEK